MLILKEEKQTELVVKKSRFITYARKCSSAEDVKKLVNETRQMHPQANHVVHAAVINGSQFSFSDDREPKNTAGRPAFEVLKGSGISDICILIVRYFGGTLLGTGGLVKAYSDSAKLVLENILTEERVSRVPFSMTINYDLYERVKKIISSLNTVDVCEDFGSEIKISGLISESDKAVLISDVTELSLGKVSVL